MKVVLNTIASSSFHINANGHHGVILVPVLFLNFIICLHDVISSYLGIHASNITAYACLSIKSNSSDKVKLATSLENDFQSVVNCGKEWLTNVNVTKAEKLSFNQHR